MDLLDSLPSFESQDLYDPFKQMEGIKKNSEGKFEAWVTGYQPIFGPWEEDRGDLFLDPILRQCFELVGIYSNPYSAYHYRECFIEDNNDSNPDKFGIFDETLRTVTLKELTCHPRNDKNDGSASRVFTTVILPPFSVIFRKNNVGELNSRY